MVIMTPINLSQVFLAHICAFGDGGSVSLFSQWRVIELNGFQSSLLANSVVGQVGHHSVPFNISTVVPKFSLHYLLRSCWNTDDLWHCLECSLLGYV